MSWKRTWIFLNPHLNVVLKVALRFQHKSEVMSPFIVFPSKVNFFFVVVKFSRIDWKIQQTTTRWRHSRSEVVNHIQSFSRRRQKASKALEAFCRRCVFAVRGICRRHENNDGSNSSAFHIHNKQILNFAFFYVFHLAFAPEGEIILWIRYRLDEGGGGLGGFKLHSSTLSRSRYSNLLCHPWIQCLWGLRERLEEINSLRQSSISIRPESSGA
jgi:hypothetical protein